MAYQPISQNKKGGYVPISQGKPVVPQQGQPKPVPEMQTGTPFAATNTGIAVNTVLGLPKAAAGVAKDIFRGTTRGALATGVYGASRAIGDTKEEALKREFVPDTKFEKFLFGAEPVSATTEAVQPLMSFGVSEEKAKQFGPTALIGLTAMDLFTGPGKRKAITEAMVNANTIDDARKVLRNAEISDEVVNKFKLDERVVAAKTPEQVDDILNDVKKVAELPPLPKVKSDDVPTTTTAKLAPTNVVDEVPVSAKVAPAEAITKIDEAVNMPEQKIKVIAKEIGDTTDTVSIPKTTFYHGSNGKVTQMTKEFPRTLTFKNDQQDVIRAFAQAGDLTAQKLIDTSINGRIDYRKADNFLRSRYGNSYDAIRYENNQLPTKGVEVFDLKRNRFLTPNPDLAKLYSMQNRKEAAILASETPTLPPLPKVNPEAIKTADVIAGARAKYAETVSRQPLGDAKLAEKAKQTITPEGIKLLTGQLLTPISSRLERISPALKVRLRKFESEVAQKTFQQSEQILPLLNAVKKMSPEDQVVFDLARKNGDSEVIDALATRYDLHDELNKVRDVLDDLYTRAKEVGLEVEYRKDYFPRMVKNPTAYMQYLRGTENWSDLLSRIQRVAEDKGIKYTDLSDEELAGIANSFIRGYGDKLSLPGSGFTKQRTINIIDDKLNEFYESSDASLTTYIARMNDEIEGRRFFGKEAKVDPKNSNINESIGAYVIDLVVKGKIKPQQEREVADILKSRFSRGRMNSALDAYKNFEYISTMGSPISAITQIGDLAFSVYKNGFFDAVSAAGKSLVGKSRLTKEQLGIENITQEFSKSTFAGRAVDKVFTLVGLSKMDRLGKEAMINSTFSRAVKRAKANDPKLMKEFQLLYGDDAAKVMEDFKANRITEDTKFYAFNTLLDFQPVAKSEMPQKYLEMPNGRIFYTLKSFTLKQIDVFRREAIDDIASGDKKRVINGMKKLIYLSGAFMAANATADEIKDTILGRETPVSDRLADNIYRLFGATKYDIYKAREEGFFKTLQSKILFPTSIIDRATKDVSNVIEGRQYEKGPLKGEAYKLESTQTIPVAGKFYYWWMGRGAQKQEYKEGITDTSTSTLPTLPELPKLPKLPSISTGI